MIEKQPLIVLHGALGASSQLLPLAKRLGEKFDVLQLEFEGHGQTNAGDRPFRIEHFAENLASFLEEKEIQHANIFGYSMGGYVALHLAATRPELIGKVFTLATKFAWNPATSAKEVRMLDPEVIEAKVPKFGGMLKARHTALDWKEHLRKTAEMMIHLGDHPLLGEKAFAKVEIPVRLGIGDRDKMVSLEETLTSYKGLPQAELMVFPKTGHPIEKVDLDGLVFAIEQFF